MIILEKKKIIYTISIVTMFIFTYMITGYNAKNRTKIENGTNLNTIQTVALPVNNKVIVLDARTSGFQMNGAESSTRYHRSRKQLKNSFESTKFTRTIWSSSNSYS